MPQAQEAQALQETFLSLITSLSDKELRLIETFDQRINTLYEHKRLVGELVNLLFKLKEGAETRNAILQTLETLRKNVLPAFAALVPEFEKYLTEEKEAILAEERKELLDFQKLQADLKNPALAQAARKKLEEIMKAIEAELAEEAVELGVVDRAREIVSFAKGFAQAEEEQAKKESGLVQKTQSLVSGRPAGIEIDNLAYEWKVFLQDLDRLLRDEKREVIDKLNPLLAKKRSVLEKVRRLTEPKRFLFFKRPVRITAADIARDVETFTNPGEFQQYQSALMGCWDYLTEDARRFLRMGGVLAGARAKREIAKLSNLAFVDQLTGLLRRGAFDRLAIAEIARARREGSELAIALIDVDRFKLFNDGYGHEVGDIVLGFIAKVLKDSLRRGDVVCRWGGEELLVLLPKTAAEKAFEVMERVRENVEAQSIKQMAEINAKVSPKPGLARDRITISAGFAVFPEDGDNFQDLFTKADVRLLSAKETGRNRVVGLPVRV